MRVNFKVDGIAQSINCNSDKPLHKILLEISESFPVNNACHGAKCGNCIVLIDNQCVLSCLIPAFKLEGKEVVTFEGFRKTRAYHDIEKAYSDSSSKPCPQCYASKTLLIESLVNKLEKTQNSTFISGKGPASKVQRTTFDTRLIERELSINQCLCMEITKIESIVKLAYQNRRRRSG